MIILSSSVLLISPKLQRKVIYTRVSKHQINKNKYLKVINLYYRKE